MNKTILAPIRMGDLSARNTTTPTATATAPSRYLPPIMRKGIKEPTVTSLDFNSPAFPTLGSPTAKQQTSGNFKQKVLDLLEKEALDEIERHRINEFDIRKMTREEKVNDGGWEFVTFPRNRALPPLSNTD